MAGCNTADFDDMKSTQVLIKLQVVSIPPLRGIGPANRFGHARLGSGSSVVVVRPHTGNRRISSAAGDIYFLRGTAALAMEFRGRSSRAGQFRPPRKQDFSGSFF